MKGKKLLTIPESAVVLILAIEELVTLDVSAIWLKDLSIGRIAALLELCGHRAVHVPDETTGGDSADAGGQGGEGKERNKCGGEHGDRGGW